MHPSTEAFVEEARDRYDFDVDVHEFEAGTKTAEDAADQIGCDVAQIASSIVVDADGDLVVVVTSGANRVDFDRVAALRDVTADAVGMAEAGDIKDVVGWSIGGVPPFCHDTSVPVYVDETLLGFDEVWAAGGTPQAVFPIDPETLVELSDGTVESVAS